MTKLTVPVRFTAHDKATLVMQETNHHSRMGNALHKWIDDCTPGASASILMDASTLNYDVPADQQVFVTGLYAELLTVSDDVKVELLSCTAVSAGGTATQIAGDLHTFTGDQHAGSQIKDRIYDPPIRVRYVDGVRSIAIRVDANDASTKINAGWTGWVEDE